MREVIGFSSLWCTYDALDALKSSQLHRLKLYHSTNTELSPFCSQSITQKEIGTGSVFNSMPVGSLGGSFLLLFVLNV